MIFISAKDFVFIGDGYYYCIYSNELNVRIAYIYTYSQDSDNSDKINISFIGSDEDESIYSEPNLYIGEKILTENINIKLR